MSSELKPCPRVRRQMSHRTRKEREEDFEINKHYGSILRAHFGWVSCHTNADGCQWEDQHGNRGMMPSDEVRRIGAALESGEKDANYRRCMCGRISSFSNIDLANGLCAVCQRPVK